MSRRVAAFPIYAKLPSYYEKPFPFLYYLCKRYMETLKEKTAKGFFWGMMNNGTMQLLNIVFAIFLGRLLSPEDYGVTAVLAIFTAVAGALQQAGFSNALVNKQDATAEDFNAVFWFNILMSLTLYLILFLSAPLIASFFHDARLVSVSRVTFLSLIFSAAGTAHSAWLSKQLRVKQIAIATIAALMMSGLVGIAMAFCGLRYWSLVGQQLTYISVVNLIRMHYSEWQPTLRLNLRPIRPMLGFAMRIMVTNIINTLSQNLLTFIFGRLYPLRSVGLFNQANNWNSKAYSFTTGMVAQVAQPVLAQIADDDDRERRVFRKMMRFAAFISFPCMFGLLIVSEELIVCTVSAKWIESVPLLQLLALSGAVMPFYTLYQNLMMGQGRADIYMWLNIVQIALQLVLIVSLHSFGITVMVAATSAYTILYLMVWQWFAHRQVRIRLLDVLADTLPFALITAAVMAATWFVTLPLRPWPFIILPARIVLGGALYIAAMKLCRVKMLDECIEFIRKKRVA